MSKSKTPSEFGEELNDLMTLYAEYKQQHELFRAANNKIAKMKDGSRNYHSATLQKHRANTDADKYKIELGKKLDAIKGFYADVFFEAYPDEDAG